MIIAQDIGQIQTLTGFLGKTYSRFYLWWLKLRLKLYLFTLPSAKQEPILISADFTSSLRAYKTINYDQELAALNFSAKRKFYWQLTHRLLSQMSGDKQSRKVLETRLAIYLTYRFFIYADLFKKIFSKHLPKKLIILDDSIQSQIAAMVAKEKGIPITSWQFLSISWFDRWLTRFLLNREYQGKLEQFMVQSRYDQPLRRKIKYAVLLSVDFYRHLKTLGPLYQYLVRQGVKSWLVTDTVNLEMALTNLNISQANFFYLPSFLSKSIANKKVNIINSKRRKNLADLLIKLSFDYAGPLICQGLFLSRLYLKAARNLLRICRPKAVVVVSDLRFSEQALALAAKENHVPSVMVSPNSLLSNDALNQYNSTDKVAVVGEFIRQKLIRQGINPKKMTVVGDLQAEMQRGIRKKFNRRFVLKQLGINEVNKKIILAISFRSNLIIPQHEKELYLRWVGKAVKTTPQAVLVVKPHPTEKHSQVKAELKQLGLDKAIIADNQKVSLPALLQAASVVVETWSMTIFEAISANKPVVCVNPLHKDYSRFLPIIKQGGALEVSREQDLVKWLKILVNEKHPLTKKQLIRARKACSYFIHPDDGRASYRVAKLLGI